MVEVKYLVFDRRCDARDEFLQEKKDCCPSLDKVSDNFFETTEKLLANENFANNLVFNLVKIQNVPARDILKIKLFKDGVPKEWKDTEDQEEASEYINKYKDDAEGFVNDLREKAEKL